VIGETREGLIKLAERTGVTVTWSQTLDSAEIYMVGLSSEESFDPDSVNHLTTPCCF